MHARSGSASYRLASSMRENEYGILSKICTYCVCHASDANFKVQNMSFVQINAKDSFKIVGRDGEYYCKTGTSVLNGFTYEGFRA